MNGRKVWVRPSLVMWRSWLRKPFLACRVPHWPTALRSAANALNAVASLTTSATTVGRWIARGQGWNEGPATSSSYTNAARNVTGNVTEG